MLLFALYKFDKTQWLNKAMRPALVAVFGLIVIVLPWTIRNVRTMHVLCPIRDNFWLEFWAGNTGDTSNPMPAWTHPASNSTEMAKFLASGELAYLEQKHALAIDSLRRHPILFVDVTVRRFAYFWTGFWSLSRAYLHDEPFEIPNVMFCGSLSLLMLIGAVRLLRQSRIAAFPYLVFI